MFPPRGLISLKLAVLSVALLLAHGAAEAGVGEPTYVGPPAPTITALDRGPGPGEVYASGDAGVFLSLDAGEHWNLVAAPTQFPAVLGAPPFSVPGPPLFLDARSSAPSVLAQTRTATFRGGHDPDFRIHYRSDDGGRTWNPISYPGFSSVSHTFPHAADPDRWFGLATTFDRQECAYALARTGSPPTGSGAASRPTTGNQSGPLAERYLIGSENAGRHWRALECALPVHHLLPDPADAQAFYGLRYLFPDAGGEPFVLTRSDDLGKTWREVAGRSTVRGYLRAEDGSVFPLADDALWRIVPHDGGPASRRIVGPVLDLGELGEWEPGALTAIQLSDLTSPPDDPLRLYLSRSREFAPDELALFVSDDGGASWRRQESEGLDAHVFDLLALEDGVLLAAGHGGVFVSGDEGRTWRPAADGLRPAEIVDLELQRGNPDARIATAGSGAGRRVFRTSSGAGGWEAIDAGIPSARCGDLRFLDAVLVGSDALLLVEDRCDRFDRWVYRLSAGDDRWRRIATLDSDRHRSTLCPRGGIVLDNHWCSDDGGATWEIFEAIRVWPSPADPARGYGTSLGRLMETADGGDTWTEVAGTRGYFLRVSPHPAIPGAALALARARPSGPAELIVYRRAGESWSERFAVPGCRTGDVAYHGADPSTALLSACGTVHVSRDGGKTWAPVTDGLPRTAPVVPDPRDRRSFFVGGYQILVPPAAPLSLDDGRFQVTVAWRDPAGRTGVGTPVALTEDTGWFWFFNPDNVELVVKVLDGGPVNGRYWVFAASLTNVDYQLTVKDTRSGLNASYENRSGTFSSFGDTGALPAHRIVGSGAGTAVAPASSPPLGEHAPGRTLAPQTSRGGPVLELHDGRFRVSVDWEDFQGNAGSGQPDSLTPGAGTFWFFRPDNVELVVKVLDGRPVNGHWWLFAGALTNVAYRLTVTDTATGQSRVYDNPSGTFASFGDTTVFAGSP